MKMMLYDKGAYKKKRRRRTPSHARAVQRERACGENGSGEARGERACVFFSTTREEE